MEKTNKLSREDAILEDLFDTLNGNTEYITLEQFRHIYGNAEFHGLDGGEEKPFVIVGNCKIFAEYLG